MYPLTLALASRPVLVVGGGAVGERRVKGLLLAQAHITVVAPDVTPFLASLADDEKIALRIGRFTSSDLNGMLLVFAATDDTILNAEIVTLAHGRGLLVNDAIASERGDFAVPAVHRSGPMTFAVDTGGASPSFSRRIRDEVAAHFDERYGRAAVSLRMIREIVAASVPLTRRAAVMEDLANLPLDELSAMQLVDQENAVEQALLREQARTTGFTTLTPILRICATRRSALALAQTRAVMAKLAQAKIASTILEITSAGDAAPDRPIAAIGSGVFVTDLELALQAGRADYAVHSCKDLPGRLPDDLCIAAITKRADPRDAFCSDTYASFHALPAGAKVGTASPRRKAQLMAIRRDLTYVDIRGNVDTRLQKLRNGEYDALILAMAGLERLHLSSTYVVPFETAELLPAVGQGALAIEARRNDALWCKQLSDALTDIATSLAVTAERGFLRGVQGGCHAPIAAYATLDDFASATCTLTLRACIFAPNGEGAVHAEERLIFAGPILLERLAEYRSLAEALGMRVARQLLDAGGGVLLTVRAPLVGKRILLGRTIDRPSRIAGALRAAGAEVTEVNAQDTFEIDPLSYDAILIPSSGAAAVLAARLSVVLLAEAGTLIAAMGPNSAAAASELGLVPQLIAAEPEVGQFVQTITQALLEQER